MAQPTFGNVIRVGIDLGQAAMQLHAVDANDQVVAIKQVRRPDFAKWCLRLPEGCVVAMEASSGAHHWGRQLSRAGLQVRLISPLLVAPYRLAGKVGKNDANDAEAICEAASRPRMRFVPVKTELQQSWLAVHSLRDGYVKERTACMNRVRGILSEFGIVLPRSRATFRDSIPEIFKGVEQGLNPILKSALRQAFAHFRDIERRIEWCEKQVKKHAATDPNARRALSVWGVGVLSASALAATAGDLSQFKNGRQFGAWLGLVPRQHSTGGTARLGRISKRGDVYLRKLLVMGAQSALRTAPTRDEDTAKWAIQLRERVGWRKAAVALANKNARILWAVLSKKQELGGCRGHKKPPSGRQSSAVLAAAVRGQFAT